MSAPAPFNRSIRRLSDDAIRSMIEMRGTGATWQQIGKAHGLTKSAAFNHAARWSRDPQAEFDELDALSRQRALNGSESVRLEFAIRQLDGRKTTR